jgi:hypothetical protein
MNQLYFRDLRRRVEALEEKFFPEPEPNVTVYWVDEDDVPEMICNFAKHTRWDSRDGTPIPEEYLHLVPPAARAAMSQQPTAQSP